MIVDAVVNSNGEEKGEHTPTVAASVTVIALMRTGPVTFLGHCSLHSHARVAPWPIRG